MERVELLTIEDTFWISRNEVEMLVISPGLRVPKGGFKSCTDKVIIATPDGNQIEATAHLSMSHFKISDPNASIEKRWKVTLWLTDRTKEEVPIGSKILVSPELKNALLIEKVD